MVTEMPSYAELCARLDGLSFAHGIFTNLDYDHVSPFGHRTYEDYVACKKRMFSRCQNVLANLDDPRCDEFIEAAHAQVSMTFSPSGDERADFSVHDIRPWQHGHAFTVTTPSWEEELRISMPGSSACTTRSQPSDRPGSGASARRRYARASEMPMPRAA
jgi:UDP-N-acetylmuramoyl-L-alanyl-D-glutamate--2,6-diaminopimelate ligase